MGEYQKSGMGSAPDVVFVGFHFQSVSHTFAHSASEATCKELRILM